MNCSYHSSVQSNEWCKTCTRPLCAECAHRIKGTVYCQDCLVRGAEWAAMIQDPKIPKDAPKRAAMLSLVPGLGAVYNNDYIKAITFFSVFAGLILLADEAHGIFGAGAVTFLLFSMIDSYRVAQERTRAQFSGKLTQGTVQSASLAWGVFLIVLGLLFFLQNLIPYRFLQLLWPFLFIFLGAYLIFRALAGRTGKDPLPGTGGEQESPLP